MCVFFCVRKEVTLLNNKAFSQLTHADKERKLDIAVRSLTDNLIDGGQVKDLIGSISPDRQYNITVHQVKRDRFGALVDRKNVIHIFVPDHLYERK